MSIFLINTRKQIGRCIQIRNKRGFILISASNELLKISCLHHSLNVLHSQVKHAVDNIVPSKSPIIQNCSEYKQYEYK